MNELKWNTKKNWINNINIILEMLEDENIPKSEYNYLFTVFNIKIGINNRINYNSLKSYKTTYVGAIKEFYDALCNVLVMNF